MARAKKSQCDQIMREALQSFLDWHDGKMMPNGRSLSLANLKVIVEQAIKQTDATTEQKS